MRLVVIESPYAGDTIRNERYARAALADCLKRGEAPFASHLLYTQPGVLDDLDLNDRALGMAAGFRWAEFATARAVYADLGITKGMQAGIDHGVQHGQAIEYRSLGDEWSNP